MSFRFSLNYIVIIARKTEFVNYTCGIKSNNCNLFLPPPQIIRIDFPAPRTCINCLLHTGSIRHSHSTRQIVTHHQSQFASCFLLLNYSPYLFHLPFHTISINLQTFWPRALSPVTSIEIARLLSSGIAVPLLLLHLLDNLIP